MVLCHQAPIVCLESGGQSIFEVVLAGHHPTQGVGITPGGLY